MCLAQNFSLDQHSHCFDLFFWNRSTCPLTSHEVDHTIGAQNPEPLLVRWHKLHKHIAAEKGQLYNLAPIAPAMCFRNGGEEGCETLLPDSFRNDPFMPRIG